MSGSTPDRAGSPGVIQTCAFSMEGRLFGFDILDVREVVVPLPLTVVHHAPKSVLGCVNIRGQVHLIVDLRRLFGFAPREPGPESRYVVFKPTVDEPFAVLVDAIAGVFPVPVDEIVDRRRNPTGRQPDAERRRAAPPLGQGVCQLEQGLLVVLNARAILENLDRQPHVAPERTA